MAELRGSQTRSRGIIRGERGVGLFNRLLACRSIRGMWVCPRRSSGVVVGGDFEGPGIGPSFRGVFQAIGDITFVGE